MKHIIFIDANVYLDFYRNNPPKTIQYYLTSLQNLKNNIFITQKIVDEVNKNKLHISIEAVANTKLVEPIKEYLTKQLREFFVDDSKKWEGLKDDINKKIKEMNTCCTNMKKNLIGQIAKNEDDISQALENIFAGAHVPTSALLNKARERKELGNPPGKDDDPLGDQLSWEQLLPLIKDAESLSIITRDKDYFTPFYDEYFLNVFLRKELLEINQNLVCSISSGVFTELEKLQKAFPELLVALPPKEELDNIIDAEKENEAYLRSADFNEYVNSVWNTPQYLRLTPCVVIPRISSHDHSDLFGVPNDSQITNCLIIGSTQEWACPKCSRPTPLPSDRRRKKQIFTCQNCNEKFVEVD